MTDALYWIWFQQLFGFASVRSEELLAYYSHPGKIYESSLSDLKASGAFKNQELNRIAASKIDQAEELYQTCQKMNVRVLTPCDEEYPTRLRNIYAYPTVLYVEGDLGCIDAEPAIGMVGTRRFTDYGKQVADSLSKDLAGCGFVVVSGMAAGIDTVCHVGALKAGGRTIAVTGTGPDIVYPAANKELKRLIVKQGAVVSEFPPGTAPLPTNFPIRNRIISGLSLGVAVIEGRRRSGSLITAGHALTQGKDIFAVPGSIFSDASEGPHWLIRQGAIPATCARDIIEEYLPLYSDKIDSTKIQPAQNAEELNKLSGEVAPAVHNPKSAGRQKSKENSDNNEEIPAHTKTEAAPAAAPLYLTANQRLVYEALGKAPVSVDKLANTLEIPIKDILSSLTQLEIYGLIKAHPGRAFSAL